MPTRESLSIDRALCGLCHLYLDALGPLSAPETHRALREDKDLEGLVRDGDERMLENASLARVSKALRKLVIDGSALCEYRQGCLPRYRLRLP